MTKIQAFKLAVLLAGKHKRTYYVVPTHSGYGEYAYTVTQANPHKPVWQVKLVK